MAEHDEGITTLNTLIATTIDSITGYEDSAKNVESERFREIFRSRADERQRIVEELRAEVRRLGGNPEDDGSFIGKAHQRFEDQALLATTSMRSGSAPAAIASRRSILGWAPGRLRASCVCSAKTTRPASAASSPRMSNCSFRY